ncbi:MAG: 16S rRNA (guanine(966)-N(2))-methyltransferase RsmD [Akkermansiaceae bacterium]
MRIIAGTAGRRNFRVPKAIVRPTTDRTREAMFSMLAQHIPGAKVLDLFAGSGALGLESLSRGAESCVFVDESRECVNTVKLNLKTLRLHGGKVVQSDVMKMIGRVSLSQYDVIFADPPYWKNVGDRDFVKEMFECENFSNVLVDDGMLVIEADERAEIDCGEKWEQIDRRKYGGCAIFFFQKKGAV